MSRDPQTVREAEDALICLGLQLQCATTPGQRRRVWSRVCEIKALQRQLAAEHAADPRNDP